MLKSRKLRESFAFIQVHATFVLILIFLSFSMLYQNCGVQKLTPLVENSSDLDPFLRSGTQVPLPEKFPGDARVVIILDQSFSMVWNKCAEDLDGTNPLPTGSAFTSCDRSPGVDAPGNRYAVIEKWLDELEILEAGEGDVKVMIIPFSGGKAERPSRSNRWKAIHGLVDEDQMKFISIDKARTWIQGLKSEQEVMKSDGKQELMGTTVFRPALQYAYGKIVNELNALNDLEKLEFTPFKIVFMSDGAYKPITRLREIVMEVAGCPDCNAEPDHFACTCFNSSCYGGTGDPPGTYCNRLLNRFDVDFGNVDDNKLEMVKEEFNSILGLKLDPDYRALQLDMKFVTINWEGVPEEDKNTESDFTHNLFEKIQGQLLEEIPTYNLTGPEVPFPIAAGMKDGSTYIIRNLYAINTNAFVDKFGELVSDSDGDGVSDEKEISLSSDPANPNVNYDPSNPRTNGVCLDYISVNYGCQTIGCNRDVDDDGDGLNQCEEATLGTIETMDTDEDHIPDIFEAIRGLNPKVDQDVTYSSGDNFSDTTHFRRGVDIGVKLEDVADEDKVRLRLKLNGYDTVTDKFGQVKAVGNYTIQIDGVPIVPVKSASNTQGFKYALNGDSIPLEMRLDPQSHAVNMNQILFLMEISTKENPDYTTWHILRKEVDATKAAGVFSISLDLEFKNFIQIREQQ